MHQVEFQNNDSNEFGCRREDEGNIRGGRQGKLVGLVTTSLQNTDTSKSIVSVSDKYGH